MRESGGGGGEKVGGLSRQNFGYLKCSIATGKKQQQTTLSLFKQTPTISTFFCATCHSIFEKSAYGIMIPLKKDSTIIIVRNEHKILLLSSSMAFIILPYNMVHMIIYYLLFRRVRIPYKINDFNCLINKTWINALVK